MMEKEVIEKEENTVEVTTTAQDDLLKQLSLPVAYAEKMTPEVARRVQELKTSIDIHDKDKVVAYGVEEQTQLGSFADSILNGVGTKEVGEAGAVLATVIGDIKGYNADCSKGENGLFSFLKKQRSRIKSMQTKYKSVADNMSLVVEELKNKDLALGNVSRNFENMYIANQQMYEFLTMVIYAGEQKLLEEKKNLEVFQKEAEASGDLMEIQKVSDYKDNIIRFERRLYDLKLTRTMSIQQAPKIRAIQKSADSLSESIKTTIFTSIPLWKEQMAMALGMQVVENALDAVNAVKDATNAMLIANSNKNKELTLKAAQASERGVVDIETINILNQNLLDTMSGAYDIAQKAIADREEGAKQLQAKETELKTAIVKYSKLN